MNERIRKLAEQAGAKFIPGHTNNQGVCFGQEWDTSSLDPEKFAELIARECMSLMNDERDYYSKPGAYEPESYYIRCAAKEDAFDAAASLIKNHFGVEE